MKELISKLILLLGFCLFLNTSLNAKDVYVDSNNGDDSNPGTLSQPYKTIQKAADVMAQGDVCYIRCGVYREKVIVPTDGLTFRNYNDEYVLITGLDILPSSAFTSHQGGILKAAVANKITQVFIEGARMNWARWPNEDGNMLNRDDMVRMDIKLIDNEGTKLGKATILEGTLPEKPKDYWAGAYLIDVAVDRNIFTANKGRISGSEGNVLFADKLSWTWARGLEVFCSDGGVGYIIGHLGLIDVEKEWYWGNDELYIYPPTDINLSTALIEVRTRTFGFDLTNREGITLNGLNFKASVIQMENTTNCHINECTSRFGSPFSTYFNNAWGDYANGDAAIHISGTGNTVKNSYVGHTWGHGISLWSDHSTIDNNIIEQCDWIGERMSPLFAPGDDNTITRNTIQESGREGIELGNLNWIRNYAKRALIQHNHLLNLGFLCPDAGSIYVNHQGGDKPLADSEISYNIIHDFQHPWVSAAGGIYLDNGSSGYLIHHNIIWNVRGGVDINDGANDNTPERYSRNIQVYHNTIINTKYHVELRTRVDPRTSENIVVKNNHGNYFIPRPPWNDQGFQGTELEANRDKIPLSEFEDETTHNYLLTPESPSVNAGVVIPGINDAGDGASVDLPDIGALEYGGVDWRDKVGATIPIPEFKDATVCKALHTSDVSSYSTTIFPNPAQNSITIDLSDKKGEALECRISTVNGTIVKSKRIDTKTVTLDISALNNGIYIIELFDSKQTRLHSQKIVKN